MVDNIFENNSGMDANYAKHDTSYVDEMNRKLAALRKAVKDEGRVPSLHRHTMRQHRQEWPVLWAAIDDLIGP